MSKYIWVKRSEEWIKENPNKGTMYKIEKEKATRKKYESRPKKGSDVGIYAIICEQSKSAYIGQSINMDIRMRNHKMFILGRAQTTIACYDKMKLDCAKYGIESFEFRKHKLLIDSNTSLLLDAENEAMIEFLDNGYTLYNRLIGYNLFCPSEYITQVKNLIKEIQKDPSLLDMIGRII